MKRFLIVMGTCLLFVGNAAAQPAANDAPATKEEVEKYLQVVHSKETMAKMVDVMSKPMHQMIHDQYVKDKDKLPADFEARMNKMMDETFKSFPWDEMLEAVVPVYQKHLTKGDVDALVVFYSSPTGQKLLQEMPAIMTEAMQTIMPLIQKSMEGMRARVEEETAQMLKETPNKPSQNPPAVHN